MKKIAFIAIVALALLSALAWAIWWSTGSCRPLDRLLGLSGCTNAIEIAEYSPLTRTVMSPVDADGHASLFGQVLTADGYQPGLIRLDPVTGGEVARYPLPIQNGFSYVVLSAVGRQAALSCMRASECLENEDAIAIVDVADGRLIETLPRQRDTYPKVFPGESEPGSDYHHDALFADGGQRIVNTIDDRKLVLEDLDGNVVAVLMQEHNWRDSWLAISPSTRFISLLLRDEDGVEIHLWDARDGTAVASFMAAGRGTRGVAWAHDERAVFALLRLDGADRLARFALP